MRQVHWTVAAMCDVIVKRGSTEWLRGVADAVPEAHVQAFREQLGSVVRELISRGEHALASDVVDALVDIRVTNG